MSTIKQSPMGKLANIKIPVIMYHEIVADTESGDHNYMTPLYFLSAQAFENQIKALSENGYKSLLLDEVDRVHSNDKYIIITFDDGHVGNHSLALPVLMKYGFRATFFIAVKLVGKHHYMNWKQLQNLVDHGMSIQSHSMSHRPLHTLSDDDVFYELDQSRKALEDKLQTRVTAISFPHGSYNKHTIAAAEKAGYHYLCNSDIQRVYLKHFMRKPVLVGRFAVTGNLDTRQFLRWIKYDPSVFMRAKWAKESKNLLKKLIGIRLYSRLYRLYFNIK